MRTPGVLRAKSMIRSYVRSSRASSAFLLPIIASAGAALLQGCSGQQDDGGKAAVGDAAVIAMQPNDGTDFGTAESNLTIQEPYEPDNVASPDNHAARGLIVPILFATDRQIVKEDDIARFGDRRDERREPSFGATSVVIPSSLQQGSPSDFKFWKLTSGAVPGSEFISNSSSVYSRPKWRSALQGQLDASTEKSAIIFVHGFNNNFNDAVQRAAQISYRLKFDGPTIVYSWPSAASALGYEADSSTKESSASRLTQMLVEVADRTSVEKIFLIGHSMGTHIMSDAIIRAAAQSSKLKGKLQEVILAAPDIDNQFFREEIASRLVSISKHVTLYCSNNDQALNISKTIHKEYPRAGDCSSKIVIINGMDTIDASEANSSFVGHAYVSDNETVLNDMFYIIKHGIPAGERMNLSQLGVAGRKYWAIKKLKN